MNNKNFIFVLITFALLTNIIYLSSASFWFPSDSINGAESTPDNSYGYLKYNNRSLVSYDSTPMYPALIGNTIERRLFSATGALGVAVLWGDWIFNGARKFNINNPAINEIYFGAITSKGTMALSNVSGVMSIYIGGSDTYFYRLNASNPNQVFEKSTNTVSIDNGDIIVSNNGYAYYLRYNDGYLYQVNASNITQIFNTNNTGYTSQYVKLAMSSDNNWILVTGKNPSYQAIIKYNATNISGYGTGAVSKLNVGTTSVTPYHQFTASKDFGYVILYGTSARHGANGLYQLNLTNQTMFISGYLNGTNSGLDNLTFGSAPAETTHRGSNVVIDNGYIYWADYSYLFKLNETNMSIVEYYNYSANYGYGSNAMRILVTNNYIYFHNGNGKILQFDINNIQNVISNRSSSITTNLKDMFLADGLLCIGTSSNSGPYCYGNYYPQDGSQKILSQVTDFNTTTISTAITLSTNANATKHITIPRWANITIDGGWNDTGTPYISFEDYSGRWVSNSSEVTGLPASASTYHMSGQMFRSSGLDYITWNNATDNMVQFYYINSTGQWQRNPGMNASNKISGGFYKTHTAFNLSYNNNLYYMNVTGGYVWNGSQFISNASLTTGLSLSDTLIYTYVFNISGDGRDNLFGNSHGYTWNGNTWSVNDTLLTGGLQTSKLYPGPSQHEIVFEQFNGVWWAFDLYPSTPTSWWFNQTNYTWTSHNGMGNGLGTGKQMMMAMQRDTTGRVRQIGMDNAAWISYSYLPNLTYVDNGWLEIGTPDGNYEWNQTGNISLYRPVSANTSLIGAALTTALNNGACDCTNCSIINKSYCNIPYIFHSDDPSSLYLINTKVIWSIPRPVVRAVSPINTSAYARNTSVAGLQQNFTCNYTYNLDVADGIATNLTLYVWYLNDSSLVYTNNSGYSSSSENVSTWYNMLPLKGRNYKWNCLVASNYTNLAPAAASTDSYDFWAMDGNQTLIENSSIPYQLGPNSNTVTTSLTNTFSCLDDSVIIDHMNISLYNVTGSLINSSGMTAVSNNYSVTITLPDGFYTWNCIANETDGTISNALSDAKLRISTKNLNASMLSKLLVYYAMDSVNNTNMTQDLSGNNRFGKWTTGSVQSFVSKEFIQGIYNNATNILSNTNAGELNVSYLGAGGEVGEFNSTLSQGITMAFWYNPGTFTSGTSPLYFMYIVSTTGSNQGEGAYLSYDNSNINFINSAGSTGIAGTSLSKIDKWYRIVITINSSNYKTVWVNGVKSISDAIAFNSRAPELLLFGRQGSNNPKGYVDEVSVYNGTLTAAEIVYDYNNGAGVYKEITTETIAVSNITWLTTGGYNTTSLYYNQVMDWVKADVDSTKTIDNATITVFNPAGVAVIDHALMDNVSLSQWNYTTDFTLNQVGTWTISIDSSADGGSLFTGTNSTFNVSVTTPSAKDGWYGYSLKKILSDGEITAAAPYEYDLFELQDNLTQMETNFNSLLLSINSSRAAGAMVGINYVVDFNILNTTVIQWSKNNITTYFPQLLWDPYFDTIAYISLELVNQSDFTDAQKATVLNNLSTTVLSAIANKYPLYSKTYNGTALDTAYIISTPLIYVEEANEADWINREAVLARNNQSLNRVYVNPTAAQQPLIKTYQFNILDLLRSPLNLSIGVTNISVAGTNTNHTSGGDVIVFNNANVNQVLTVNVSNMTNSGKDFWDTTNKIFLANDSVIRILNVNVSAYSATLVFVDDLDNIQMTSDTTGTLYKQSADALLKYNYSDGTRDGSWSLAGDNDIRIELFDPHYSRNQFLTYYGWLNTSYINLTENRRYDVLIIADSNIREVSKLNCSSHNADWCYGYISVADYANTEVWQIAKEAEVDFWLATNDSMNIFIDGLDIGLVGGANFSEQFKRLVDYVRVSKQRKAILNTYTAYEQFATWGDGVMKESCVQRWNGASAAAPDNYTREDWELELNKSQWYQSHNIDVYCQAFGNRSTNPYSIVNYTNLMDVYYASKVLGYENFYYTQPDFNYDWLEYVPDLGTDLNSIYQTEDNETYHRHYSGGLVYYNSSSGHGWADTGETINNVSICFDLYDEHADAVSWDFVINKDGNPTQAGDYSIPDTDLTLFDWKRVCKNVNASENGRYVIEAWIMPRATAAGHGISIGNVIVPGYGVESWYDSAATDSWSAYPIGQNWEVEVNINKTLQASVDTLSTGIVQSGPSSPGRYNLTLTTNTNNGNYSIQVISYQLMTHSKPFKNISWYNPAVGFVVLNATNSSECLGNNPPFDYMRGGDADGYSACFWDNDTDVVWRVSAPSLYNSQTTFQLETDSAAPKINFTYPTPSSGTILTGFGISTNVTVDEANLASFTTKIYDENHTQIASHVNDSVTNDWNYTAPGDGLYFFDSTACDTEGSCNSTETRNVTIDTLSPKIDITYPGNGSYYNYIVTDLNYTYTEANPNICVYSVDDWAVNTTVTCGDNATGLTPLQGWNNWRIWINDSVNNWNETNVNFYVDTIAPNTTLISPPNMSYLNYSYVNFTANLLDNAGIANATLYIYNATGTLINQTTETYAPGILQTTIGIVVYLLDGVYNWFYQVFDWANNVNTYPISCYQETANVSTICGGLDTGVYGNDSSWQGGDGSTSWFDGDWSTRTNDLNDGNVHETYINYTKPNNMINASWIIKTGALGNIYNLNIPQTCLNEYSNTIALMIESYGIGIPAWTKKYCRNDTGWELLNIDNNNNNFWEEAMNWTIEMEINNSFEVTIDTIYPLIQFVSPTDPDGSNLSRNNIIANATTTELNPENLTIQLYNTTDLVNLSYWNGTVPAWVNFTNLRDGWYYFNATSCDMADTCNSTETRDVYIDTVKPMINFTYMTEYSGAYLSSKQIVVNATAEEAVGFLVINNTLQLYNSTGELINYSTITIIGPGIENYYNFTVAYDGVFFFNATACDLSNNCNSTETRNVTIDTTYPLVQFVSPTDPDGANLTRSNIIINATSIDTNVNNLTINLYNSTDFVNESYWNGTVPAWVNFTNLRDGWYYFNATSCDVEAFHCNSTETRSVLIDTVYPKINFTFPTEISGSNLASLYIAMNSTANDTNLFNHTARIYTSGGVLTYEHNVATTENFYNFTIASDGQYFFNTTVCDKAGQCNTTEIRNVTIDTASPRLTIDYPIHTHNYTTKPNHIDFTLVEGNLDTCLYDIGAGNVTLLPCNSPIALGATTEGNHTWKMCANDTFANINCTETNFTVDTLSPIINNQSASGGGGGSNLQNNSYLNFSNMNFTINVTDAENGTGLANYTSTIYNQTGGINEIVNISSGSLLGLFEQVIGIIIYLADGVYTWGIEVTDLVGNVFVAENITFTVDTQLSKVWFVFPTEPNGTYINTNNIIVNVSANDTNFANMSIYFYDTLGALDHQFDTNLTINYSVWVTTIDGMYSFNATAWDKANNTNYSETRYIIVDTATPKFEYVYPTPQNDSMINSLYFAINISASDPAPVAEDHLKNITLRLYDSTQTLTNTIQNTTINALFVNFSVATNGVYYYNGTICDIANNCNITLTRNLTVDTIIPIINFTHPTISEGTYTTNSTWANVTATDANIDRITIYLYNITGLYNSTIGEIGQNYSYNFTEIPDGEYYLNATVNDTAGNLNWTETRTIRIGVHGPVVSYTTPTATDGSSYATKFKVNATAFSVFLQSITLYLWNNATEALIDTQAYVATPIIDSLYKEWTPGIGVYKFNGTAVDSIGHTTNFPTRTVIVTGGVIPVTSCRNLDEEGVTYRITADITDNTLSAPCFIFTEPNIILDCDNHTIKTNQDVALIFSNQQSSTINRCIIDPPTEGIHLENATNALVDGGYIFNVGIGINIINSTAIISNVNISDTTVTTPMNITQKANSDTIVRIINCTYSALENVTNAAGGDVNVTREWYYGAYVRDKVYNPLDGAVVVLNTTSTDGVLTGQTYSLTSMATGYTPITTTEAYKFVDGIQRTWNPYTIVATYTSFRTTDSYNALTEKNNVYDIITLTDEIGSTPISRQAMRVLLAILMVIGIAASVGFFMYRMRDGESVVDIWKYFIIMIIWIVMFIAMFLALTSYVMKYLYPTF